VENHAPDHRPTLAEWKSARWRVENGTGTAADLAIAEGPLPLPLEAEAEAEALADIESARPGRLGRVWRPICGYGDWFSDEPPRRKYLLTGEIDGKDAGVLPLGKVGMIAAAGAAGKTWLLMQLALSVPLGRDWLGFRVASPGKVLLALGEEDAEEAQRRFYYACLAAGLTAEERRFAASRIWVLPLAGQNTALTASREQDVSPRVPATARDDTEGEHDQADGLPVTPLFWEVLDRLERSAADGPWRLIVFDPMSRFAGSEVETDNAQATRFVQALERFAAVPGNPTVLFSHHTGKLSRREGHSTANDSAAATAARGASALTDAVRWQANLEPKKRAEGAPEMVVFRVVKNNYGRYPPDTYLVRDPDRHGALRCATENDVRELSEAVETERSTYQDEKRKRELEATSAEVSALLAKAIGPLSSRAIRARIRRRGTLVDGALAALADAGLARRESKGWVASECVPVCPECVPDTGRRGVSRVPLGDTDTHATHERACPTGTRDTVAGAHL
jgi:RecA-family ATPase